MLWVILEIVAIIIGFIITWRSSSVTKLIGIFLVMAFLIALVLSIRNYCYDKNRDEKLDKSYSLSQKNSKRLNVLEGFHRVDSEYAKSIAKYGGTVFIKLRIEGIPPEGSYLFDYGNKDNLAKNRVSLYLKPDKTLNMSLYDDDSKNYEISTNIAIGMSEENEIMCLWNKRYGEIALFVNGKLRGKMEVKPLNVKPIAGELMLGSNFKGEKHACMVLHEVRIYSFKN